MNNLISSYTSKVLPLQSSALSTRSSPPNVKVGLCPLDLLWEDHASTDSCTRLGIIELILTDHGQLDLTETKIIDAGKWIMAKWDNNEMVATKLDMKSPLLSATILHHVKKKKTSTAQNDLVDNTVYGTVSCLVRGASMDDLLAYFMDFESMFFSKHEWESSTISEKILEKVNGHHSVFYYKGSLPHPFQNRDFVWSFVWQKLTSKQCICVLHPAQHEDRLPTSDTVRGESTRVFRFTEVKPKVTNFELVFRYVHVPRTTRNHTAWHPF